MKNIKRKREIDINTYVNTNTGETLISELKKLKKICKILFFNHF